MTAVVSGLGATLLPREELIAQIDKGRGLAAAAKVEVEEATVERQRLIDITDLKEPHFRAGFRHVPHVASTSRQYAKALNSCWVWKSAGGNLGGRPSRWNFRAMCSRRCGGRVHPLPGVRQWPAAGSTCRRGRHVARELRAART